MHKILLVDDEPDIVEFLKYNLEAEKFEVLTGHSGNDAIQLIKEKPDLIILDIMMPGMSGFEVCSKIRSEKNMVNIPIIFLTAKAGEADEIKGLELGASDYIKKPISPKKLIARVKANLRKHSNSESEVEQSNINIGPLNINREKYEIEIDGNVTLFPKKEFELLSLLAKNPGKVFDRDTILKEVWGTDVYVVDRTIDVHIRKIREKLGKHSYLIETIKSVGYRFKSVE